MQLHYMYIIMCILCNLDIFNRILYNNMYIVSIMLYCVQYNECAIFISLLINSHDEYVRCCLESFINVFVAINLFFYFYFSGMLCDI